MSNKYTIYCWWMNDDEMSDNRKESLNNLLNISKCNVELITKKTLSSYILPNYPLHEGFKYLSEIQQGDYLKCYFMHHYGGGYSDIKKTSGSWISFFDSLYSNDNLYGVGYHEIESGHVAILENCTLNPKNSKFCRDFSISNDGDRWDSSIIKSNWNKLIGNGCFIFKKNTPFTNDWWNALNEKMDGYLESLKRFPAQFPRDANGHINPITNQLSNYPIKWAVINGNIFHPLTLKYSENILKNLHYPNTFNYQ